MILGNGPSLKGFDFASLCNIDSLGMNAAYRYWERIDWYPTHYVCLDDQLIETHADAIYDLVTKGKIKTAFLISKILDYHPDLIKYSNVYYLESFNASRHQRVADKGISCVASLPFNESDPSKVTTGAYAVRYGAHLGYEEIAILGVDLRYVEIIPEAQETEGIRLVMTTTPTSNPNYFFNDYQRAGDKFNTPNPASHGRNLHVASFEVVANDMIQYDWASRVFNSNKKSVLYDKAIFPFADIRSFAQRRRLAAVVVPTTAKEVTRVVGNIDAWDQPLLAPCVAPDNVSKPDLIFAFSCSEDLELTTKVKDAVEGAKYLKRSFSKVEVKFVGLKESLDYYEKDYSKEVTGKGYKSGPNEQFFELITSMARYGEFIFYMESDCVPLRQGWLDQILALAEGDDESWIIGSYYRGIDRINDRFALHLNGNALYRVGDPEFINFVVRYWRPRLYQELESSDKRLAYDCLLSYLFTGAEPQQRNEEWQVFQEVAHRFRATSVIQNISGAADMRRDIDGVIRSLLTQSPTTFLVHGMPFYELLQQKLEESEAEGKRPFSWGEAIGEVEASDEEPLHSWMVGASLYPKLLMIDSTPVGQVSATGQLKQTFLGDWPSSSFLQIWESGEKKTTLHAIGLGESMEESSAVPLTTEEAFEKCRMFDPDVIYFRPVDSGSLFEAVERVTTNIQKPLVIHMMDDWPVRLRDTDGEKYAKLGDALRRMLARASCRLSICDAMSKEYRIRYGGDWHALANGVDLDEFPNKDWAKRGAVSPSDPFVIRYMGALADDMTFSSVKEIGEAVAVLENEIPVRFEIHTMDWCRTKAEHEIGVLPGVSVGALVSSESYRHFLSGADALVIAYNFNATSIGYTGLSLANKMPECLASGVPVLAYGPPEVATIDYLKKASCSQVVDRRDASALRSAIKQLVTRPDICRELTESARAFVAKNLTKKQVQKDFRNHISRAKENASIVAHSVVGPLEGRQGEILTSGNDEIAKAVSATPGGSRARLERDGSAEKRGQGKVTPENFRAPSLRATFTGRCLPKAPAFLVVGNGPSMRGFDFNKITGITTIGMNAAYRYWDEIGWYPTYYACLDTVVGLSHQSQIERLVANADKLGIRGFLLRRNLIDKSQILRASDRVYEYERLSSTAPIMRGRFITTGSHAARFGAYLGYRNIYLLGIDCGYVERVNGAKDVEARPEETSTCALELSKTPKHNPNYFFDSYQQAGDRYNVPNVVPDSPTHLNSWRVAARDLEQHGVRVLNANLLSKVDAFDFCPPEDALAGTATVIPKEWVLGAKPAWPNQFTDAGSQHDILGPFARPERASFDELRFVKELFGGSENGIMLDVGGHFGSSARMFATAGWKIVSFEPDPSNREKLLDAARAADEIEVDERAVERVPGKKLALFASPESTGISTLAAFRETHAVAAIVTTTNVGEAIREYGLTHVDLLKIDVEGFELEVLKGVPWETLMPEVIVAEFENRKTRRLGYCFSDMVRFLERRGYVVLASEWYPVIRYGSRHDWHRFYYCGKRAADEEAWGNLIALRQPVALNAVKAAAEKALRVEAP